MNPLMANLPFVIPPANLRTQKMPEM
jgi:hypothetical protein